MNQTKNNLYLSDKQVSVRYGVSRGSVWRWVRNGDFPSPVKFSPGCVRWALDEVEAHEEAKRTKSRLQGV